MCTPVLWSAYLISTEAILTFLCKCRSVVFYYLLSILFYKQITLFLREESESEEEMSSSEEETPRRASYKGRYQELVGKVMCMECTDKRKGGQCPVLVVLPDAHPMDVKPRDQLLVRSFRDAKL